MELTPDLKELLELFNEKKVKYLIVGGVAVNKYGYPRYTHDIDFWIWINEENATRIREALQEFGFSGGDIVVTDFLKEENIIKLGYPPNRIDIMTTADGIDFLECFDRRVIMEYDEIILPFIHIRDLIHNKLTTARPQDLADAAALSKIAETKNEDYFFDQEE